MAQGNVENIKHFRGQNPLLLLCLFLITGGIYGVIWVARQAPILNKLLRENGSKLEVYQTNRSLCRDPMLPDWLLPEDMTISKSWIIAGWILVIMGWLSWIIEPAEESILWVSEIVVVRASYLWLLILTFKVRAALNTIVGAEPGSKGWANGWRTAFFGSFGLSLIWLQVVINRNRRLAKLAK